MRSTEIFGILPVAKPTRTRLGLLDFHLGFAEKKKTKHTYLAKKQNTRVAVLPIHTKAERWLFAFLVSGYSLVQMNLIGRLSRYAGQAIAMALQSSIKSVPSPFPLAGCSPRHFRSCLNISRRTGKSGM